MARYTTLNTAISDDGKVNWRGDQIAAPQGGQGIFDTSSIALAELGARKVVGDRVFRYASAGAALAAGDGVGAVPTADVAVTAGGLAFAGQKVFTYYSSASRSADFFAEGYLMCKTGTDGNRGMMYRSKSHPTVTVTTNVTLALYEPLAISVLTSAAGLWFAVQNLYANQIVATGGVQPLMGVAPVAVSSGDYFWMQTWGPASIKASAGTVGTALIVGATGAFGSVATVAAAIAPLSAIAMQTITASTHGFAFLQVAP